MAAASGVCPEVGARWRPGGRGRTRAAPSRRPRRPSIVAGCRRVRVRSPGLLPRVVRRALPSAFTRIGSAKMLRAAPVAEPLQVGNGLVDVVVGRDFLEARLLCLGITKSRRGLENAGGLVSWVVTRRPSSRRLPRRPVRVTRDVGVFRRALHPPIRGREVQIRRHGPWGLGRKTVAFPVASARLSTREMIRPVNGVHVHDDLGARPGPMNAHPPRRDGGAAATGTTGAPAAPPRAPAAPGRGRTAANGEGAPRGAGGAWARGSCPGCPRAPRELFTRYTRRSRPMCTVT